MTTHATTPHGSLIPMYHRMGNPFVRSIVRGQYTLPLVLRWQLRTFRALDYTPLTLGTLLECPEAFSGCIAVTFDDGYAGVWRQAFPLLQEYGFPCTIFMVCDAIGKTNYWDEQLGDRSERMLGLDELRQLADAGVEIGSHTLSHAHLCELSLPDLRRELRDSKSRLEDLLGTPVRGFAYPYGEYDARVRGEVEAAGYRYAVTTHQATITPEMDRFTLTRMNMRWNTVGIELHGKIRRLSGRVVDTTVGYIPKHKKPLARPHAG